MNAKSIVHGVYGGLAGGIVFGVMMGMMGALPMIGKMVGDPSAATGFIAHLAISAMIGASFAVLLGRRAVTVQGGLGPGLFYGGAWWLLGPLTLMPLLMGMGLGANWNMAAATKMLPSLIGHLMYGGILGAAYGWFRSRAASLPATPRPELSNA